MPLRVNTSVGFNTTVEPIMTNKTKKDDDEIKPYTHYEENVSRRVHHYYLSSAIREPDLYIDMVHKIQTASSDEMIYIHLNTPGGHLDTGVQIINAMQATRAHVTVSIEGNCHSLGTLIFLAADEFVVHDNCLMMFHNFSGGTYGKGNEQQSQIEAQIKWFNTLAKKLYVPFLSLTEFDRVVRGEDIWLQSEDIRTRLNKMVKSEKTKRQKKSLIKP
jgi:ATP-dependent protease ClpP protease subunit